VVSQDPQLADFGVEINHVTESTNRCVARLREILCILVCVGGDYLPNNILGLIVFFSEF
jgi:hypothetical protein